MTGAAVFAAEACTQHRAHRTTMQNAAATAAAKADGRTAGFIAGEMTPRRARKLN